MSCLRQALRAATATAHSGLEVTLSLDPATLTADHYGRTLQILHAVRAGWDPALARFLDNVRGPHLAWLEQDLQALQLQPLPPEPTPLLASELDAWGFAYVLEGSALGGRSMLRNLETLGLTPDHGARYFAGRGKQTGAHWQDFLSRLEAQASETNTPYIAKAAAAAFANLDAAARRYLNSPR